jgi:hypothetical protein
MDVATVLLEVCLQRQRYTPERDLTTHVTCQFTQILLNSAIAQGTRALGSIKYI